MGAIPDGLLGGTSRLRVAILGSRNPSNKHVRHTWNRRGQLLPVCCIPRHTIKLGYVVPDGFDGLLMWYIAHSRKCRFRADPGVGKWFFGNSDCSTYG